MWREVNEQGFLVYSFVETVERMYPFYVMRVAGGALYLIGALIMVYNLIRTVRGERREEVPMGAPVAVTS
jgi:cytochrome c oxidase cbb3-type subunit 1